MKQADSKITKQQELDEVDKKYPDEIPAVTYIPDADTLILTAPHGPPFVYGNLGDLFFLQIILPTS